MALDSITGCGGDSLLSTRRGIRPKTQSRRLREEEKSGCGTRTIRVEAEVPLLFLLFGRNISRRILSQTLHR